MSEFRKGCCVAFFDIDGTLLVRAVEAGTMDTRPTEGVKDSIRAFTEAGNVAILSTGRPVSDINHHLMDLPFSGVVGLDGAYAELEGEVIVAETIPDEIIERLAEECYELGANVLADAEEGIFYIAGTGGGDEWTSGRELSEYRDFHAAHPAINTYKLVILGENFDRLNGHAKALDELEFFDAGAGAYEYTRKGVTKGTGGTAILNALRAQGVEIGHVLAFGDSPNDFAIFDIADTVVVMGDADADSLARADVVTGAVAEDGVPKALEQLANLWR